jgi:hypothetical protein
VNAKDLGSNLITLGCDDNNIFQGARIGVFIQMKETIVPFMIKVHGFVQHTNSTMLVLLKFNLVANLVRGATKSHVLLFLSFT